MSVVSDLQFRVVPTLPQRCRLPGGRSRCISRSSTTVAPLRLEHSPDRSRPGRYRSSTVASASLTSFSSSASDSRLQGTKRKAGLGAEGELGGGLTPG